MAQTIEHPHRRLNALTGDWILVSPHRTRRPWLGKQETPSVEKRPAHDPKCLLCAGNTRQNGEINPQYTDTFVFDNDFPAILPERGEEGASSGLLQSEPVAGACRVICFSPRHDLTLPEMPVEGIRKVVDLWAAQMEELGAKHRWVQLFENKGEIMGCSNPHPHGQIWCGDFLPNEPAKEDRRQLAHWEANGSPLLLDYLKLELESGERVVLENEHWAVLVPYWATWPYETLLLPKRHVAHLPDLTDSERAALADVLKRFLTRYDNRFQTSFPYSMGWHGSPTAGPASPHWQLHAHFFPPLLRSASVKKFMVGYEMLAEAQRDLTPERAAQELRDLSEVHFKSVEAVKSDTRPLISIETKPLRIVQITPGTGNFYCGTCLRDNALVTALRQQGHDATLIPLYLPHVVDEKSVVDGNVRFFGGINVFLQQKSAFFRSTPAWVDRWFDAPDLLKLAAARSNMTSARALGEITLSMVLGENGKQAKEVEKIVEWLRQPENRPDVVSLSNLLLIGMARRIREALNIPVVCSLQGEEAFIDALPDANRCWDALRERADDVTRFIAVSRYYRQAISQRLHVGQDRIKVVYNGINLEGYVPAAPSTGAPPVIGYLARMHPGKGLDLLVEAFILLKQRNRIPHVSLRVAGNQTPEDRPFVDRLRLRLRRADCANAVQFLPNPSRTEKQAFLHDLSLFCVPAHNEAFGLYLLEAWASAIPVVQPASGAFAELVEVTGGGFICKSDDPQALAVAIEEAFANRIHLAELGRRGMNIVRERFSSASMARAFAATCAEVTG